MEHQAAKQPIVSPGEIRYKGRRIFIPVNVVSDDPSVITVLTPNQRAMTELHQRPLSYIPDDGVISELCRDLAPECVLDDGREEMAWAEPEIVFEEQGYDENAEFRVKVGENTLEGAYMLTEQSTGALKFFVHTSQPFWYPEYDDRINNALRVKCILNCNRIHGVQQFLPAYPYLGVFMVPKLYVGKKDLVLRELRNAMLSLFRDNYEIRIRGEHHRKTEGK